jgi:hypothetical protein
MLRFLLGMLISGSVLAADIHSTGPKSGPTTQLAIMLGKNLGGLSVEASGDCQTDVELYRKTARSMLVTGHAAMLRGQAQGKDCAIPWSDSLVLQANTYYLICRLPSNSKSIIDTVKISIPGVYPLKSLSKNLPKARFINVSGGGESLAAVIAGDVDWAIMPSPTTSEPQASGKIVCEYDLNTKSDRYLGKTVKLDHEPFYTLTFIFVKGYNNKDSEALTKLLKTPAVVDFMNQNHWYNVTLWPNVDQYKAIVEQHQELYKIK